MFVCAGTPEAVPYSRHGGQALMNPVGLEAVRGRMGAQPDETARRDGARKLVGQIRRLEIGAARFTLARGVDREHVPFAVRPLEHDGVARIENVVREWFGHRATVARSAPLACAEQDTRVRGRFVCGSVRLQHDERRGAANTAQSAVSPLSAVEAIDQEPAHTPNMRD